MRLPRVLAGLLLALLLPVLVACGGDTTATDDPSSTPTAASSDTPSEEPTDEPTDEATWACDEQVSMSIDYVREPDGFATPMEAALAFNQAPQGAEVASVTSDGKVVLVPAGSDEIAAEASVVKGTKGWYVDGWTTCAS